MRILLVSWYFPPANDIAALRVGKIAEYLRSAGHQVWVLTGERDHPDKSLPVALPEECIIRAPWFDVDQAAFPWRWGQKNIYPFGVATVEGPTRAASPKRHSIIDALNRFYINLVRIPDQQIGWLPYALRAGNAFLQRQPVDIIYASGPPFTTFLAARSFSRRFGVPWIAEYRDGWSRYVYTPKPKWREAIDAYVESRVIKSAKRIVAVSEPWADFYRDRFGIPALAVYNGFDPESLSSDPPRKPMPEQPLTVTYVGALYRTLRDPSVLYEAIKRAGLTPKDIQVSFYGSNPADIYPLVDKFGVADFVAVKDRVPYKRSLEIQRNSDVLLLLQSPKDPRNVPAKIFEYLASRRPILGLGLDEGIPAKLIRERQAGLYHTDADAVAQQLKAWIAQKRATGFIPNLPPRVHSGLSRTEQLEHLVEMLRSAV